MAAIVIAGEEAAPIVVEKHPMSEMNCANATKRSASENVAGHPIDCIENNDLGPEAEAPGLDGAHSGILIAHIIIFARAQLCNVSFLVRLRHDGIKLLMPT